MDKVKDQQQQSRCFSKTFPTLVYYQPIEIYGFSYNCIFAPNTTVGVPVTT
jgi:hypothetical protein